MDNVVGVRITGDGAALEQALQAGGRQVQDFGKKVSETKDPIEQMAQGLKSALIGSSIAVGLITLKNRIYDVVQAMVEAQVQVDKLRNGLNFAVGRDKSVGELDFIRTSAASLGLEFISTAQQYTKLAAAARGTTLEGRQTRDVFTAIAQASTVMGLSAEETQGALLAITQMISKGKVQAEELRGQLGERLPGAFQIAARSMGVTTAELDKMLETGQVLATDFLPKFARQLSQETAPEVEAASKSMQSSINRLSNAWTDLKQNITQGGVGSFLASTMGGMAQIISGVSEGVRGLSGNNALLNAARQVNDLDQQAKILRNRVEGGLYGSKFQAELDAVNAKLEIAKTRFRELNNTMADQKNPYVSGDDRVTQRAAKQAEQARADRAILDKIRQTNSGQSATFASDLKNLAGIRERGGFSSDKEYSDLVAALIKKEGGVKAESKTDTAQRLTELRLAATIAQEELGYAREKLGIERALAEARDNGAGELDQYAQMSAKARAQAAELDARDRMLYIELQAAKAAEGSAKLDADKIQALTKRLQIEKKIEDVAISRAQLDYGDGKFLADSEKYRQAREDAGTAKGLELMRSAADSKAANLPNAERAAEMLRVESEAMRKIVDVNYSSAEKSQKAWDGYYAWYEQRSRELAEQFASGPQAGVQAYLKSISDFGKQTADVVSKSFSGLEDSLTKFFTTGKGGFRALADSIISDLIRIEVRRSITGPLAAGAGGGGSGIGGILGSIGSFFGGFFADGGSPPVGLASIVGERGPELFIPRTAGTIIPNGQIGSGQSIVNHNYFTVGDVASMSKVRAEIEASQRRIGASVQRSQLYGGSLS